MPRWLCVTHGSCHGRGGLVACFQVWLNTPYFLNQACLLQDPEMLGDGRLRDLGPGRQGADRLLSFAAQLLEDGPPGRIGERSEEHIVSVGHAGSITPELLIDV